MYDSYWSSNGLRKLAAANVPRLVGPSSNGLRKLNVPLLVYYGILCRNDLSSQTGIFCKEFLAKAVPSVRLYVVGHCQLPVVVGCWLINKIFLGKQQGHQSSRQLGVSYLRLHYSAWRLKNKTIMASTKEDGTSTAVAAAAEQLGSVSLGGSVEGKDNETETKNEDDQNNEEAPAKCCSACGKKSNALKKCNGCKCVWYCDKKCQNKHRKEHKKECRPIKKELDIRGGKLDVGTELDIGPRGEVPPREECPICMRVLPIQEILQTYYACCGKTICGGCDFQHKIKSREQAVASTCAFCRTAAPESDEEILARLSKRAELKDPEALYNIAMNYGDGGLGLPVDQAKCIELLRESADLGFPDAQYNLGKYHHFSEMGLEQNEEEVLGYCEKAAERGDVQARHNVGGIEFRSDNHLAALRHFRLSASAGFKPSVNSLIARFEVGMLRRGDLAETLQAFYRSRAEMKSEDRDKYIAYLKKVGEYKEEYER